MPRDVEVIAIAPAEIRVVLDAIAEKTVPIVADITGEPAPGARLDEVVVEPRQRAYRRARPRPSPACTDPTDPVSVEGRETGFSGDGLALQAPGVRVREGQVVTVRVRIRPAAHSSRRPGRHRAAARKAKT